MKGATDVVPFRGSRANGKTLNAGPDLLDLLEGEQLEGSGFKGELPGTQLEDGPVEIQTPPDPRTGTTVRIFDRSSGFMRSLRTSPIEANARVSNLVSGHLRDYMRCVDQPQPLFPARIDCDSRYPRGPYARQILLPQSASSSWLTLR